MEEIRQEPEQKPVENVTMPEKTTTISVKQLDRIKDELETARATVSCMKDELYEANRRINEEARKNEKLRRIIDMLINEV